MTPMLVAPTVCTVVVVMAAELVAPATVVAEEAAKPTVVVTAELVAPAMVMDILA